MKELFCGFLFFGDKMSIYYLNKGLILEQEIVKSLRIYFEKIKINSLYNNNYAINITNEHPFSALIIEGDQFHISGKFPSIVVTTSQDNNGIEMLNQNRVVKVELQELDTLIEQEYLIAQDTIQNLKESMSVLGFAYGIQYPIRRSERISIEIWCENIQLKNEIYELVRLYVCGSMNDFIASKFPSINFACFAQSIQGQRSNNWNFDFGVALSGAQISFSADYVIEQTVIDTALREVNENIYEEVANHVKNENYHS